MKNEHAVEAMRQRCGSINGEEKKEGKQTLTYKKACGIEKTDGKKARKRKGCKVCRKKYFYTFRHRLDG